MGVDASSKVNANVATVNRVTQAVTESNAQVAKAVQSADPAAVTKAITQATSQVTQALQKDGFQPPAKTPASQAPWASSFAAAAPSLSGKPVEPSASKGATVPATQAAHTSAIKFTAHQAEEIGKKVGNALNDSRNVVSNEDSQKSGFDKSSTVVQQSNDTNCGAAAVATLASSKKDKSGKSAKDVEGDLTQHYSSSEGTTPKQVAQMLAHEGLEVTGSNEKLDRGALTDSLKNGGRGLAMVDSNAIDPSSQDKGTGKAHWVTLDGMDKDGNFQVKDPASGRSYYVSADQLDKAVNTVRDTSHSGGLLTVKNSQGSKSEEQLAQQGTQDAGKLGDTPGTGSNWRKSYGQESS